jgi:glycosyltransferase involved in cell wall biosynthesis
VLPSKNTILTIHDVESLLQIENKFKRFLLSFFWLYLPLKKLNYITTISNTTRQKLIDHFSLSPHKIRVIPNCYSLDFIEYKKEFNKEQPNVLIIGTKKNKNLENLIYAARNISCKLIIVGKLSEKQINLLQKNKIKYLNYFQISHDEMIKVYRQSDIFYFASFYEGFGIPILEAQATGRVVITSNCSAMPEVAGAGAYYVDPKNINEIKNAIKELIFNDNLRNKLINIGLENCKLYKPEIIAKKYCDLYQEVINNNCKKN